METSGHGCCGVFSEDGSANLHCRCGAPVGVLIDECVFDVEVRLGALWQVGGDDEIRVGELADDRVRRSLDRWSRVRFAGPPVSIDTHWDWTASELSTSREVEHLELHLIAGDDGVAVHAVVDGRVIALPSLPSICCELSPSSGSPWATRGSPSATTCWRRFARTGWCRSGARAEGKDVELIESPASTTYPTGFDMTEAARMPLAEARRIGAVVGRETAPRGGASPRPRCCAPGRRRSPRANRSACLLRCSSGDQNR
ncbi:hypothetical protein [Nannocystis pusilla]|uniref:hypothetical protein n=1 Tax=Nannocystis pusilla TaxID=889268 RepID=UPI003B7FE117